MDSLYRIKKLHFSIITCLETISAEESQKWSADSLTDAITLLLAITSTAFLSSLVITHECLQYLKGLTISLQEEAKILLRQC